MRVFNDALFLRKLATSLFVKTRYLRVFFMFNMLKLQIFFVYFWRSWPVFIHTMIDSLIIWIGFCMMRIVIWCKGWCILSMVWQVGIWVFPRMACMIFYFSCLVWTRHNLSNSPWKDKYLSNNHKKCGDGLISKEIVFFHPDTCYKRISGSAV